MKRLHLSAFWHPVNTRPSSRIVVGIALLLILAMVGGKYAVPLTVAAPESRPAAPVTVTLVSSFERRGFERNEKTGQMKPHNSGVGLTFFLAGPDADKVARVANLHVLEAIDDQGSSLMPDQRWNRIDIEANTLDPKPHFEFFLNEPARSSQKIRCFRGMLKVTICRERHELEFPWNKWNGRVLEDPALKRAGLRIRMTTVPEVYPSFEKFITLNVEGNPSSVAKVGFCGPDKLYVSNDVRVLDGGNWRIETLQIFDPASLVTIDISADPQVFEIPIDLVNVDLP